MSYPTTKYSDSLVFQVNDGKVGTFFLLGSGLRIGNIALFIP